MINTKLLVFVTPQFIYHGWSTWKTFWEEKLTGEKKFTLGEFTDVNMKICGFRHVSKHREIKGSDKYITLNILLKLHSLDKS